jgi:hypothetical protein
MSLIDKLTKNKKPVEPFNLFGENSLISSRDDYIFVAASIGFGTVIFIKLMNLDLGISLTTLLIMSFIYFILAFSIRRFKSRAASILALLSFSYVLISRILENDTGGLFFFTFIFVAASYRAVRASFVYHKK